MEGGIFSSPLPSGGCGNGEDPMFKPHEPDSFIKKRAAGIKKSLQTQDHYHSKLIVHPRIDRSSNGKHL